MQADILIKHINTMIADAEYNKEEYYADGGTTDGYIMSQVGRIAACNEIIKYLKLNRKGN